MLRGFLPAHPVRLHHFDLPVPTQGELPADRYKQVRNAVFYEYILPLFSHRRRFPAGCKFPVPASENSLRSGKVRHLPAIRRNGEFPVLCPYPFLSFCDAGAHSVPAP